MAAHSNHKVTLVTNFRPRSLPRCAMPHEPDECAALRASGPLQGRSPVFPLCHLPLHQCPKLSARLETRWEAMPLHLAPVSRPRQSAPSSGPFIRTGADLVCVLTTRACGGIQALVFGRGPVGGAGTPKSLASLPAIPHLSRARSGTSSNKTDR